MDQVLRIVFCNGQVAERRGDDEQVAALFAADEEGLIDYVGLPEKVSPSPISQRPELEWPGAV